MFALPEYIEATLAEREAEARRTAAALDAERAVGRDRPGLAGALKLLAGELLWTLAGIEIPAGPDRSRRPRSLGPTALRGAR